MKNLVKIFFLSTLSLGVLIPVSTAQTVVLADEYGYAITPPSLSTF